MYRLILSIILTFYAAASLASGTDSAWVFAYFNNNGEDGLHLAYSTDAYHWKVVNGDKSVLKPTAGNDKLMRDPCIIRGADGKFHMVWTVSWGERSIGYASSNDLIHWSAQQTIPVLDSDTGTLNAWAPEIFYDNASNQYMIYWASTIPGKFPKLGVKPDDKYNHRMYYILTKDFRKFTPAKILYDKGFSVIDATIQKKGDQYLMFLKNENEVPPEKNIRIASSNQLTQNYTAASSSITGKYWAEGPTVLYTNGKWIVYFDKYVDHSYGAVESADLVYWNDVSDKIALPKGIRHGTVIQVTKEELEKLISFRSTGKPGNKYKLVWADEFDNEGKPDSTNWTYENGFVRNEEFQWYQPQNVFCKNGLLTIEAKKEKKINPGYVKASKDWRKKRKQADYTSACILTRGQRQWQYGRFEMRGRIDIRDGIWPAWWTLGIDKPWPANGEIDIMEYYRGRLLANIACLGKNEKTQWYSNTFPIDSMGGEKWASQFHVWRMDWRADVIELYVDDVLLNSTRLDLLINQDGYGFNPFKQPHYMLLNLAIGGQNGGDPSKTSFPSKFEVDYVRVYQEME